MKNIFIILTSLLLMIGCSNKTKTTLGLVETLPDEYQVSRNKPLEVPPHYNYEEVTNSQNNQAVTDTLSASEKAMLKVADE